MNYLLDTNHWSYYQRGHPNLVAKVRNLPTDAALYMPVVAQAELLGGVELTEDTKRREDLRNLYQQVVTEAAEIIPIDSRVAERFASIFAQLKRDGRPIGTNDIWIAAIAMTHDMALVSNDTGLRFVRGIRLEDWTRA